MDNLSLAIELRGREVVLRLSGALDVASAPCLRTAIEGVLDTGAGCVVLDLSDVTFLDSQGIGVIAGCCKALRRRGSDLVLRNPHGSVDLVLRTVGLERALRIESPPAAA